LCGAFHRGGTCSEALLRSATSARGVRWASVALAPRTDQYGTVELDDGADTVQFRDSIRTAIRDMGQYASEHDGEAT
jgi:hypothetical protein